MRPPGWLVVLAIGMALLGSACGKRSDALGAGEDIDGCAAYAIIDSLEEPSPEEPDEVEAYADATLRILDRIRADFKIQRSGDRDDLELPPEVIDDYAAVERSITTFREALDGADGDEAKVREAMGALAADRSYLAADLRLAEFHAKECP